MKFSEKLAKLTEGRNRSDLARAVRLPPSILSNYINRGSTPRADIALSVAKALDVPLQWLVDDEQSWPAPPSPAAAMSTAQLAEELSRRSAGIVDAIWEKLRAARGADWVELTLTALALDPSKPIPKALQKQLEIPSQLNALRRELENFVPPIPPMGTHALVRSASIFDDVTKSDPTILDLFAAVETLQRRPGFAQVFKLSSISLLPSKCRPKSFDKSVDEVKREVGEEAARLKAARPKP
jgi:transcriptional regulator with XRE-family HTH domain